MSALAVAILLAIAVAASWLGCLGFARLAYAFDRLHCTTFIGVAAGFPVLLASFAERGADTSVLKVLLLVTCALLNGAALAHATGRACFIVSKTRGTRHEFAAGTAVWTRRGGRRGCGALPRIPAGRCSRCRCMG